MLQTAVSTTSHPKAINITGKTKRTLFAEGMYGRQVVPIKIVSYNFHWCYTPFSIEWNEELSSSSMTITTSLVVGVLGGVVVVVVAEVSESQIVSILLSFASSSLLISCGKCSRLLFLPVGERKMSGLKYDETATKHNLSF